MTEQIFYRFNKFGLISDEINRKKISEYICKKIQNLPCEDMDLSELDTANFASSIYEILNNSDLKELCEKDSDLAEKITKDILDFVNKTSKIISRSENPFKKESLLFNDFKSSQSEEFETEWKSLKLSLENIYAKQELDLDFYEDEFYKSLEIINTSKKKKINFHSVKEHFLDKWEELLLKKQTHRELGLIDEQRKAFCQDLYKQIEELKKLQVLLEPFTKELGRLWDMSKGNWQKINLDVLKKYSDLLKRDKNLMELAEMLGRMRGAEKEFEEVLFTDIVFKSDWEVEHASKSDLIGVHESDDLSCMLPSETALLTDKTLQEVFLKKYAEKKLQTFEYESRILTYKEEEVQIKRLKEKKKDKGPFIICVDTSGSMHGTPETIAKVLCFAIMKVAVKDDRKCYLISFSTSIQTLELTDIKNSLDKIIEFLSMSFYGGTDATPAMDEALKMLGTKSYKEADVIMVSDFVMPAFEKKTNDEITLAKKNKTKFHSLVIGKSLNNKVIDTFDNNWFYDTANDDSVLTLVKNISKL